MAFFNELFDSAFFERNVKRFFSVLNHVSETEAIGT